MIRHNARIWFKSSIPDVNDDISTGVLIGDFTKDTSSGTIYQCDDNTDGAAAWTPVGGGGGVDHNALYNTTVLAESGLISYWKLDEASGTTTFADSKGSNNMSAANSPQCGTTTPFGAGFVEFDTGSAQYLKSNSLITGIPVGANNWSYEIWFNAYSVNGAFLPLLSFGTNASQQMIDIRIASGQLEVVSVGTNFLTANRNNWANNAWHHLVVTYTATTVKVYMDGVLWGTATLTALNLTPTADGFALGGDTYTGFTERMNGKLSRAAVYSSVLTATQVRNHYAIGNAK